MIKTLTLSAVVAVAAATRESVVDIRVDEDASTKYWGVVAWQPFYQRYINKLFSSDTDAPDSFNSEDHLCRWHWRVVQPFEIDERYSIAVTHNCPAEHIRSITFDVSWEEVIESSSIVHDDDTEELDAELLTGVKGVEVYAKTEAGWGEDQDFGFWHPKLDGAPSWTYAYQVNYADETPATEPVVTFTRPDTPTYQLPAYEGVLGSTNTIAFSTSYGAFELDDDFVGAGPITLTKIEGSDQGVNTYIGGGCRSFTFTNGTDTVTSGWLGGSTTCDKRWDGNDAALIVVMEPDYSQGLFTERILLSDFRNTFYSYGIEMNGHQFGNFTYDGVTTRTVEVSANQTICGIKWFRQDSIQQAGHNSVVYLLWQPILCEIQQSAE